MGLVSMPSEFGRRKAKLSTEPAARLDEVHSTLLDEPLQADEWELYEPEVNRARGEDAAKAIGRWYGHAINGMRSECGDLLENVGLGQSEPSISDKLQRLVEICHQRPKHDIPDAALIQLVAAGADQIFDGMVQLAVQPLVVDVLDQKGLLGEEYAIGAVLGGSV
jgi:hypothetical protein